jgi:hypothetical protein
MDEGLKNLFPTLLGKDMPYLEVQVDQEGGEILKSDKPLRVSLIKTLGIKLTLSFAVDRSCIEWWSSCWRS